MKNNESRFNIFIAGCTLVVTMSCFMVYSNVKSQFYLGDFPLKKNNELQLALSLDTIPVVSGGNGLVVETQSRLDTSAKRILLIGDSEIEGLRNPFYDYCIKNGHKLELAFIWYSATDRTYASNDTLKHLIQNYHPDYIVMAIGLNQLFQTNFDESEAAVRNILNTFNGIHYTWVGPANWVEDKGINDFYGTHIDSGCFYLSKNLKLDRASDGRHPSTSANRIWMDSIADFIQNKSRWRIKMQKPDSLFKGRRDFRAIILNARK